MFDYGQTGYKWLIRLLYFFNFLFGTFGFGLVILGGVVYTKLNEHETFVGGSLTAAAITIIIVGIFIFFVAMLGCYGTKKESVCFLIVYLGIVIIILIMEFSVGIAGYGLRGPIEDRIRSQIQTDMADYPKNNATMDPMQRAFACCGSDDPFSWLNTSYYNTSGFPKSCCKDMKDCKPGKIFNNSTMNGDGCVDKLKEWAAYNGGTFGGVILTFSFIEIIGLILTCVVIRKVRNQYTLH